MTHSRLKLTWTDSSLNPVWIRIPFERALNCMQYMWMWQHSYIQHRRKLCFYIANCLTKRKLQTFLSVLAYHTCVIFIERKSPARHKSCNDVLSVACSVKTPYMLLYSFCWREEEPNRKLSPTACGHKFRSVLILLNFNW